MTKSNKKIYTKIIICSLGFVFLTPNFSFASFTKGQCSKNDYTIATINGINTDRIGAEKNMDKLSKIFGPYFNNQEVDFQYLLNQTHLGGVLDIFDAIKQGLFDEKSDYDLVEMWNDASQKVTTQKLLLVGHSQGNFYANNFYDKVTGKVGGVPSQSIGVYSVATPASRVAGGGKYVTSDTDKVIAKVVGRVSNILPPNVHIDLQNGDDKLGHNFSDIYLKYQGAKIISDIESSLDKLRTNDMQGAEKPCLSPPELTIGHKVEGAMLALVDHPVYAFNQTLDVLGQKYLALINNAGSLLADKIEKLIRNGSAAVILASSTPLKTLPVTNSTIAENVTSENSKPTSNLTINLSTSQVDKSAISKTPPDLPFSGEANSPDQGEDKGVVYQISHPDLLLGNGGVAASSLSLPDSSSAVSSPSASNLTTPSISSIPSNSSHSSPSDARPSESRTGPASSSQASSVPPSPPLTPAPTPNTNPPVTTAIPDTSATKVQVSNSGVQVFPTFSSDGKFTQDITFNCTTNAVDSSMMYIISDSDNSFHFMNGGTNGTFCPGGQQTYIGNGQKFSDFTNYANYVGWYYISLFTFPKVCYYNSSLDCVFSNPPSTFARLHRNNSGFWSDGEN